MLNMLQIAKWNQRTTPECGAPSANTNRSTQYCCQIVWNGRVRQIEMPAHNLLGLLRLLALLKGPRRGMRFMAKTKFMICMHNQFVFAVRV